MPMAVIFPVVVPGFLGGSKGGGRSYAKIDGREVFLRCVELYATRDQVSQRIVVVPPADLEEVHDRYSAHLGFQGVTVIGGGTDWFGCVAAAVATLEGGVDQVMIHDGACPAVPYTLLDALEEGLGKNKNAAGIVPVLPTRSAFADVGQTATGTGLVSEYVDMTKTYEVQSPQLFRKSPLVAAYGQRGSGTFMDDAELVQQAGGKIATVMGSKFNMRIDSDEMVRLGKDLLEHMPKAKAKTPLTPFGEAEW